MVILFYSAIILLITVIHKLIENGLNEQLRNSGVKSEPLYLREWIIALANALLISLENRVHSQKIESEQNTPSAELQHSEYFQKICHVRKECTAKVVFMKLKTLATF